MCGTDVFDKLTHGVRGQVKQMLATIYDHMAVAADDVWKSLGLCAAHPHKGRNDVYASALRDFLGGTTMNTEWCTIQVKCISRGDSTGRHKDIKNCTWSGYDKTGALCYIVVDDVGTLWSLKFISNSRLAIGVYFDGLLGVKTLITRVDTHFKKLQESYEILESQCKSHGGRTHRRLK